MRDERRSPNLLLTVIVPAYNEFATVEVALRRVRAVPLRLEIIVVNDASTDGTREVLDGLGYALRREDGDRDGSGKYDCPRDPAWNARAEQLSLCHVPGDQPGRAACCTSGTPWATAS